MIGRVIRNMACATYCKYSKDVYVGSTSCAQCRYFISHKTDSMDKMKNYNIIVKCNREEKHKIIKEILK